MDRSTPDPVSASTKPDAAAASAGRWTPYSVYVVLLLTLGYVINFADRHALAVIQELIRREFHLADWQLGLLGGAAFTLFYSILGVPIARLAERTNRINVISVSLALWSAATAFCGLSQSIWMLIAGRIGVGVGEAGGTPPAHSVIASYIEKTRRATALAIFSTGAPLGTMLAAIVGGWIAQQYGWRAMFLWLGGAGVLLAIVTRLTIREPARAPLAEGEKIPSLAEAARDLFSNGVYRHVVIASVIGSFCAQGIVQFTTSFFMRTHGLDLRKATLVFGLAQGVFATLGTLAGGILASRLQKRWVSAPGWVCAGGTVVAAGFFVLAFVSGQLWVAVTLFMAAKFFQYGYPAPSFSMMQAVAHERARATAMALYLLVTNLLGLGLGPVVIGAISDGSAAAILHLRHVPPGLCEAAATSPVCAAAQAEGLRAALIAVSTVYLWAALHFALSARFMRRDARA